MRVLVALLVAAPLAVAQEKPRLLVVISVDQMRPDTLTRFAHEYTGGLKRVVEKGRHFRGWIDHGATQTGPGHATMLTGCHPARSGIVANQWIDWHTLAPVYCVEDGGAPVYGRPDRGRSPRAMLRDTLGDWMKANDPRTRVYSVSAKDRSAVLMGGRSPDGAFWLVREEDGGFSTSRYYAPDGRPDWLVAFNRGAWIRRLPEHWTYEPVDWLRADDDPRESPRYGRAAPHPLRHSSFKTTLDRLYVSPYIDEWTLLLARDLVGRFELGTDGACDLLSIGLSATDTVGHSYGPFSQEIRDTVLRLDRHLGSFFADLDARGIPYVVALTADHGVLSLDRMKRVDARRLLQRVTVALQKRFGAGADLFRLAAGQMWVQRDAARAKGVDPIDVRAALVEILRGLDEIETVHDRAALLGPDDKGSELLRLARNSFHPDRSGDLVFHAAKHVYLDTWGTGTSHGSPHDYDRAVPLVFLGAGVTPGRADADGRTIDIAPTLARVVGLEPPADLDGRALSLSD